MNIEILGVDPKNKGAGLMLEAIRERFLAVYPKAKFCVSLSYDTHARVASGLWGILPKQTKKKQVISDSIETLLPASILNKVGIVKSDDIDLVIDASGFAYGDFWGADKLQRRLAKPISKWKEDGKKVIVLPQAWGPFSDTAFKPSLEAVTHKADLVFARDSQSFDHIRSQVEDDSNLFQAPDFTNLLSVPVKPRLLQFADAVLVIPNEKVIASFGESARHSYLSYLTEVCESILGRGHRLILLNHEGEKDQKLADEIKASSPLLTKVEVLDLGNPLDTKAVISISKGIVSSRFHGLVSALSSGVPSLACGWSHKYVELMKDYGCEQYVVDFNDAHAREVSLNQFLDELAGHDLKKQVQLAATAQKQLTEKMWEKVFAKIA